MADTGVLRKEWEESFEEIYEGAVDEANPLTAISKGV